MMAALAVLGFIAVFLLTVPASTADTVVYVGDMFAFHQRGSSASPYLLWEFGHLLWRPFGYGLWMAAHQFLSPWSHGNLVLEMTAVLMGVNFVVGLLLTWVLFVLCRRLGLAARGALAVAAGFMLCSTILNYVHSGMSYNPGLLAQLAALLLILSAVRSQRRALFLAVLGGCALALSFTLWFPYVLTVPAVLLGGLVGAPAREDCGWPWRRERLRAVIVAALAAAILGLALFAVGAAVDRISSYPQLKQWIVNSGHGIDTDRRLSRLPTGVTRSFFYLGNDGLIIKRFAFGDPYAPVTAADLIYAGLWKVVLVFLAGAGLALALARRRETWPALAVLLCGVLPTLGFAVVLFETAEPARYEPAYLGLLVGICAVLQLPKGVRAPRICLAGFLVIMGLVNLRAYAWDLRAEAARATERAMLVSQHTSHNGVAFITSFRDPLSTYVQRLPFSPLNRPGALPAVAVIEPGNVRLPRWRSDVACRMLQTWDAGGEVWISDRLVASRPKPDWNWAEYDDSRVHWVDLPAFFNGMETDSHIGGADGFLRIPSSVRNRTGLHDTCSPES
jgi:hypothetical protein